MTVYLSFAEPRRKPPSLSRRFQPLHERGSANIKTQRCLLNNTFLGSAEPRCKSAPLSRRFQPVHRPPCPVAASGSNLNGFASPPAHNLRASHNAIPAGGARKKTGKGAPVPNPRPVRTPSKIRKVPIAPKPRPTAPANFVVLAMAGPPAAAPGECSSV